jgi:hypothetical protein
LVISSGAALANAMKKQPDYQSLPASVRFHHDVDHAWRKLSVQWELLL